MTIHSRGFQQHVRSAYSSYDAAAYSDTPFQTMPAAAQKALEKFANPDLDVAEFTTKKVDGRMTYACYVPSNESAEVRVVDGRGHVLADGTLPDGSGTFDWNQL